MEKPTGPIIDLVLRADDMKVNFKKKVWEEMGRIEAYLFVLLTRWK